MTATVGLVWRGTAVDAKHVLQGMARWAHRQRINPKEVLSPAPAPRTFADDGLGQRQHWKIDRKAAGLQHASIENAQA
jgi:hypothetical protein